jgi:hypothetical protein
MVWRKFRSGGLAKRAVRTLRAGGKDDPGSTGGALSGGAGVTT